MTDHSVAQVEQIHRRIKDLARKLDQMAKGRPVFSRLWFHAPHFSVYWRRGNWFKVRVIEKSKAGGRYRNLALEFGPWRIWWTLDRGKAATEVLT